MFRSLCEGQPTPKAPRLVVKTQVGESSLPAALRWRHKTNSHAPALLAIRSVHVQPHILVQERSCRPFLHCIRFAACLAHPRSRDNKPEPRRGRPSSYGLPRVAQCFRYDPGRLPLSEDPHGTYREAQTAKERPFDVHIPRCQTM